MDAAACVPCDEQSPSKRAREESNYFFSRGPNTYRVPAEMHAESRAKLVQRMGEVLGEAPGVVLLRGGISECRNDSDHEKIFRQESYYSYLFGVDEPDWWGMIELPSGRTTLFMPRLGPEYAVWMGEIKTPNAFRQKYRVDAVRFVDELRATVTEAAGPNSIHTLRGTNSDSGVDLATVLPPTEGLPEGRSPCEDVLYETLAECRVCKSELELRLMQYVSWVTSMAHVEVMRDCKVGMLEYQLEARFLFHAAYHGGCRHAAYTPICACGPNSAVLHYGHAGAPNDETLRDGTIGLLDMGAEYHCYCSDITCSYPINGSFTDDQRMVYGAVLDAQRHIFNAIRPGISWAHLHRLMWRVVLGALRDGGVLRGDVDEMLAVELGAVFIPCGMGHLIGLDTHDVGGYLKGCPPRVQSAGISKLRTARLLEEGMCLTVEPGCYFIEALLQPALADPARARFLVPDVLARFRGFGGVRLEDVVAVTADGIHNYTLCPRTIDEVEGVMAGAPWPPPRDEAPWLHRQWVSLDKAKGEMGPVEVGR